MRQQSFYRGACAIIERDDGKLLMNHRDNNAWVSPNCDAFFGGGVEAGESPGFALRRELIEELGFHPHCLRLMRFAWHWKGKKPKREKLVLDYTFLVRWRPRNILLGEGERADWFTVEELLAQSNLPPHERGDLELLQRLRKEHDRTPLAA